MDLKNTSQLGNSVTCFVFAPISVKFVIKVEALGINPGSLREGAPDGVG